MYFIRHAVINFSNREGRLGEIPIPSVSMLGAQMTKLTFLVKALPDLPEAGGIQTSLSLSACVVHGADWGKIARQYFPTLRSASLSLARYQWARQARGRPSSLMSLSSSQPRCQAPGATRRRPPAPPHTPGSSQRGSCLLAVGGGGWGGEGVGDQTERIWELSLLSMAHCLFV